MLSHISTGLTAILLLSLEFVQPDAQKKEVVEQINFQTVDGKLTQRMNYGSQEIGRRRIELWMDGLLYPPGSSIVLSLRATEKSDKPGGDLNDMVLKLTFHHGDTKEGACIERKVTFNAKNGVHEYTAKLAPNDAATNQALFSNEGQYTLKTELLSKQGTTHFQDRKFEVRHLDR